MVQDDHHCDVVDHSEDGCGGDVKNQESEARKGTARGVHCLALDRVRSLTQPFWSPGSPFFLNLNTRIIAKFGKPSPGSPRIQKVIFGSGSGSWEGRGKERPRVRRVVWRR